MNGRQKEKGFTLVEILIASAIGIVVLYGAFSFFEDQQNVFVHQTDQAQRQANLRVALYYLSRDIADAGYTGTPFGIEGMIYKMKQLGTLSPTNPPCRPLRPVDPSQYTGISTAGYTALNRKGQKIDAIEIWANFDEGGSTVSAFGGRHYGLASTAIAGQSTLTANTVDSFIRTIWDQTSNSQQTEYALGYAVGSLFSGGMGEFHYINSVNATSKQITGTTPLLANYQSGANGDQVAPIWKRVYFIQNINGANWLVRWDYYANNYIFKEQLAEGIDDLQFTYDIQNPTATPSATNLVSGITRNLEVLNSADSTTAYPFTRIDPCQIIAVTVTMETTILTKGMTRPTYISMSRRIKTANIGLNRNLTGSNRTCPGY